jgi:ubiquinone/menaquinone biosynthesis C-methylase UbiE
MKIPDAAVPYILYQRTSYLKLPSVSLVSRLPIKSIVFIESVFRKRQVKEAFVANMESELQSMRGHFPSCVENLLDIGFGIGGIDVLLHKEVKPKKMYLLDKNKTENSIWYGFQKQGAAYNSLEEADHLLEANGISKSDYVFINIDSQPFPDTTFDLIVSIISWGFHYPVSTYINEVKKSLSANGVLIIDVRKDTDGEKALRNVFSNIEVIQETSKHKRIVCRH